MIDTTCDHFKVDTMMNKDQFIEMKCAHGIFLCLQTCFPKWVSLFTNQKFQFSAYLKTITVIGVALAPLC